MKLESVNSSNVAAIGHLVDLDVLLVLYRDGALYARPVFTAADMVALREAPSVGQFLAGNKMPAVLIRKGGDAKREPSPERPAALNPAAGPMQTLQADDCCSRPLAAVIRADYLAKLERWECPKCGQEWQPKEIAGARHWMPSCPVVVF